MAMRLGTQNETPGNMYLLLKLTLRPKSQTLPALYSLYNIEANGPLLPADRLVAAMTVSLASSLPVWTSVPYSRTHTAAVLFVATGGYSLNISMAYGRGARCISGFPEQ